MWAGTRREEGGGGHPIRCERERRLFKARAAQSGYSAAASSLTRSKSEASPHQLQSKPLPQPPTGTLPTRCFCSDLPTESGGQKITTTTKEEEEKMRLIHNMTTIAECPAPENSPLGRVIKMAVIGGSGVGKTGKNKKQNCGGGGGGVFFL